MDPGCNRPSPSPSWPLHRRGRPARTAIPSKLKYRRVHRVTRPFLYILDKTAEGGGLWCPLCAPFQEEKNHSKVMKCYGHLIPPPGWRSASGRSHSSSSSTGGHRAPRKPSCLPMQNPFVVFQRIRPATHRTNSNLMNRLNFGRSSLSHSFHTMSAPATICSLSPREDAVQEVSHSMNVHFHFRAQ